MKGTAYLLQATLISLWWLCIALNQEFFYAFQFPGISKLAFNSFFIPDFILICILSIIRAYKKIKGMEYIILGAFAFGTLYCINATLLTQGGYLSTSVMILGLCYNIFLVYNQQTFRISHSKNKWINGLKTIIQIICIWTITLVLFPMIILKSFGHSMVLEYGSFFNIGIGSLIVFSVIGLYSACTMVRNGEGTPLPLDQTNKLVITGPYKYVRNPMAIAGIGQGMSIGIMYNSIYIIAYSILGGIIWHLVVRPIEEKDMEKRFGDNYRKYREAVKCWIPRF